jgi:hypothetical protein
MKRIEYPRNDCVAQVSTFPSLHVDSQIRNAVEKQGDFAALQYSKPSLHEIVRMPNLKNGKVKPGAFRELRIFGDRGRDT